MVVGDQTNPTEAGQTPASGQVPPEAQPEAQPVVPDKTVPGQVPDQTAPDPDIMPPAPAPEKTEVPVDESAAGEALPTEPPPPPPPPSPTEPSQASVGGETASPAETPAQPTEPVKTPEKEKMPSQQQQPLATPGAETGQTATGSAGPYNPNATDVGVPPLDDSVTPAAVTSPDTDTKQAMDDVAGGGEPSALEGTVGQEKTPPTQQ